MQSNSPCQNMMMSLMWRLLKPQLTDSASYTCRECCRSRSWALSKSLSWMQASTARLASPAYSSTAANQPR